jgi:hypothetical protein
MPSAGIRCLSFRPELSKIQTDLLPGLLQLAKIPRKRYKNAMCWHTTINGCVLLLRQRTLHDEMLLHCARIGFKP